MNAAGASSRIFSVSFWRPMRRCRTENGSGAPSRNASTSPSSTLPSGSASAAAASSGNRSVTSSSPRDHRKVARGGGRAEPGRARERPHHQRRRDADPEFAGDELVENQQGAPVELGPRAHHGRPLRRRRERRQREQSLFDPLVERQRGGVRG